MKKALMVFVSASLLFTANVFAAETMSADEVRAAFTGKTCDGHNENKDKSYKIYMNSDGSMLHKNRKRTKEVSWEVTEDGQHCGVFPRKRVCGKVASMGDGVYHKLDEGDHTNTLKNCVDGNQL